MNENDIISAIYAYGQYIDVKIVRPSSCAFVQYVDRNNAEYAASHLYNSLIINGRAISVNWAKSKAAAEAADHPLVSKVHPSIHSVAFDHSSPRYPAFPIGKATKNKVVNIWADDEEDDDEVVEKQQHKKAKTFR
jgi:hypothetical protein